MPRIVDGTVADVQSFLVALQDAKDSSAFLIIELSGTADFIQFTATPTLFELDFPLVTQRQREMEASFRKAAATLDLAVRNSKGTDGTTFLDVDIAGKPAAVVPIVLRFLGEFYGVTPTTRLRFLCHGC